MRKGNPGSTEYRVVIIGASTGGPPVLKEILARVPKEFPVPVVIVQHMPAKFTTPLAESLDACSPLRVKEAGDHEKIEAETAYLAPGGLHLLFSLEGRGEIFFKLIEERNGHPFMPSVDLACISAVSVYGGAVIGVILSGMSAGQDGVRGARVIHEMGGYIIAQDPATCIVAGMPKSVIQEELADSVLRPDQIVSFVSSMLRRDQR